MCALPLEARLHLLAALEPAGDERFRAVLARGPAWDRVLALAARDGAHGPLWRSVQAAGAGAAPPAVARALEMLARIAAFRAATREARLGDALDALAAAGIPVLLLKGAGLAVSVYRSFAERPMGDLDLMVPPGRAAAAQGVLRRAGWTEAVPEGAGGARTALYERHHHQPPLADAAGGGVMLEVHDAPLPPGHPFRFGAREMWDRAVPARAAGRPALVPAPGDQLLHLSLHFAWAHGLRGAGWRTVRDVRALAEAGALDADALAAAAQAARGGTCVYWTLRLARSLAEARVPGEAVAALRPRAPERVLGALERHFAAQLFAGAECPSPWVARRLWEAAVRPRMQGHGAARPWQHDAAFVAAGVPPADPRQAARPASWRDPAGWGRWLRAVALASLLLCHPRTEHAHPRRTGQMPDFTVGVEEEYQLVDTATGDLKSRASHVLRMDWSGDVHPEGQETMLEVGTRICADAAGVRAELRRLRMQAASAAAAADLGVVAAGLHPDSRWREQSPTRGERYRRVQERYGRVARTDHIFGMHVHVAVPPGTDRARLMGRVRAYLPHLLALSASSPLYEGEDTGYASYRTILAGRLPHGGPPPRFADDAGYRAYTAYLQRTGAIDDAGNLYWTLRPHATYPTLEFRAPDATPRLGDAVAVAALARALVAAAHEGRLGDPEAATRPAAADDLLARNQWQAARYGLGADHLDPAHPAGRQPLRDAVRRLVDAVAPTARELGDGDALADVEPLLARGAAADRIREVRPRCEGVAALVGWMARETLVGVGMDRRAAQREGCGGAAA